MLYKCASCRPSGPLRLDRERSPALVDQDRPALSIARVRARHLLVQSICQLFPILQKTPAVSSKLPSETTQRRHHLRSPVSIGRCVGTIRRLWLVAASRLSRSRASALSSPPLLALFCTNRSPFDFFSFSSLRFSIYRYIGEVRKIRRIGLSVMYTSVPGHARYPAPFLQTKGRQALYGESGP